MMFAFTNQNNDKEACNISVQSINILMQFYIENWINSSGGRDGKTYSFNLGGGSVAIFGNFHLNLQNFQKLPKVAKSCQK